VEADEKTENGWKKKEGEKKRMEFVGLIERCDNQEEEMKGKEGGKPQLNQFWGSAAASGGGG